MVAQDQKDKADRFLKYHTDREILILLNSWDPGSSKLIEACGFKALATSSMGISASLGYPDSQKIPFTEMIDAISRIVNKVSVPVTSDVEGGYGKNVREIILSMVKVIATGIVGINIEDSQELNPQLVDEAEFCERITAIRELSDSLGFHLVINARTDVFIAQSGEPGDRMGEVIRRGNKYRKAGADCIFIPDVWQKEAIATLAREIECPINILINPTNGKGSPPPIMELQELGVSRVSFGSSLAKATLAMTRKIADELLGGKTYKFLMDNLNPIAETQKAYKMAIGKE